MLRRTSSSDVDQLLTEMRSTARSRQRDPDIQAVPSASMRLTTSLVRSSLPNDAHTCVKTTSLSTSAPSIAEMASANVAACRQSPSTRSSMPERPSDRRTAHTGKARPRRDSSGTLSKGLAASLRIR